MGEMDKDDYNKGWKIIMTTFFHGTYSETYNTKQIYISPQYYLTLSFFSIR